MKFGLVVGWVALLTSAAAVATAQTTRPANTSPKTAYLGFDRNDYPGDSALLALRKTFRYTSYWLNNPPGETSNSWAGKRAILRQQGFGFLVLFTGRTDAAIKAAVTAGKNVEQLGAEDGKAATAFAVREGFPKNVLIFLDQEEGGRLLQEQADYLFGWVDAVRGAGARAGVYCSGIDVRDGGGTISTARDIVEREAARVQARGSSKGGSGERIALWIVNDQCPPSPGCAITGPALTLGVPENLRGFTIVWQYALSPRRAQFSAGCPANQASDGNCYAPGLPLTPRVFVDLNTANSPDPSEDSYQRLAISH